MNKPNKPFFVVYVKVILRKDPQVMFTHSFQLVLIFSTATVIVLLAGYAVYCRKRAKSFAHTGRLTDVETWAMKSTLSWIGTVVLTLAAIAPFIID